MALIMTSTNIVWIDRWLSDSIPLDYKAWIAGAESTEIPDPDDEWIIQTYIMPQAHNTLVHHTWTFEVTSYVIYGTNYI